jgi:hypothetical protein
VEAIVGKTYNIYCDESCHLQFDHQDGMVLGALWCAQEKSREIAEHLRTIKTKHGLPPMFEAKWNKISPAKTGYYLDVVNYFFDEPDMGFRAFVIKDKKILRHDDFKQSHDQFYYKSMFLLLSQMIEPKEAYRVYLDKKDTRGGEKIKKLHEVLSNNFYDYDRQIIERVQIVTSHEVEQMQLADLLIGAIGYQNRGLTGNTAKVGVVEAIKSRSGYTLAKTTLLREKKLNLFYWQPRAGV